MTNLVFLSQRNQARRLNAFLKKTPDGRVLLQDLLGKTEIVFLDWGDRNAPISEDFKELSQTLQDGTIARVSLPGSAQILTKAKLRDLNAIYDDILTVNSAVDYAIFFSFEGHYSLLARKLKALNSTLLFLEDGLGTYVHALSQTRVEIPNLIRTTYLATRGLVGSIINWSSDSKLRAIATRFLREIFWGAFGKQIQNREELLTGFRDFHKCYTSFPDLAAKLFPNSEQVHVSFASVMLDESYEGHAASRNHEFGSSDALFLAQAYLFDTESLTTIMKRCLDETEGRLWIKMHPRTSTRLADSFIDLIDKNPRLMLMDDLSPAENTVKALSPKKVFSLTSTSLSYVKELSPRSEAISLADFTIGHIKSRTLNKSRKVLKALSTDREVLRFFPEISQLS